MSRPPSRESRFAKPRRSPPSVRASGGGRTRLIAAFVAAVGLLGAWRWFAARDGRAPASGALRGYNVLLVSIDTLRADRVGAYGSRLGLTPTLDRLAAEGWRFQTTYAHVPLTLPSHASLLTGTYPFTNGVHDNGTFRLESTRATLATLLKAADYRAGAFVGSFVLDRRFGLDSGFDVYDDRMRGNGSTLEVVQRTAEEVMAPAADWILGKSSPIAPGAPGHPELAHPARDTGTQQPAPSTQHPFVAWVHLYDPHEPYDPPEPYASRYGSDRYAGEIAYADAALGAFLQKLRAGGALDRTLVVITADHGESLGEHGERTHGLFAYDATIRVPLILWTASATRPTLVSSPARLVDVVPTILDLVGVAPPAALDGRSVRPFVGGAPFDDLPSYFEALNANLTRGWAPLRGIVAGGVKLVDLPMPELYDLAADPNESQNLYASRPERARTLETALDRLGATRAATTAPTAPDPEAEARLRSLGYIVSSAPKPARTYTAGDDPKRLVHLNQALDDAAAMWTRGDAAGAIATLRGVTRERPDLTVAFDRLAFMLRDTGRIGEAMEVLEEPARAGRADPALLRSLGSMLRDAGRLQQSATILETLVRQSDADLQACDALGQTYARMGRARDAETMFRRVLLGSPNAAATWNNLGVLYLTENRTADAIGALSRAVAINPTLAGAHNALGVAYVRQGDVNRAVDEWKEAIRLRPDFEDARANLERVRK